MKSLFSHVFFLILFVNSYAQNNFIDYGLKLGYNFSNISNKSIDHPALKYTPRHASNLGVYMNVNFTEHFVLQNEISFSMQGTNTLEDGFIMSNPANYIILPVLFQYKTKQNFSFYIGPQFGLLFNKENPSIFLNLFDLSRQMAPQSAPFELSLDAGVKYCHENLWGLDFRYNHGIINASQLYPDQFNRVFQLGFFISLNQLNNIFHAERQE